MPMRGMEKGCYDSCLHEVHEAKAREIWGCRQLALDRHSGVLHGCLLTKPHTRPKEQWARRTGKERGNWLHEHLLISKEFEREMAHVLGLGWIAER